MIPVNDLTPKEALEQVLSPEFVLDPRDRVKRLLALRGLTARNLADRLGVTEGHLSQVLAGLRPYKSTQCRIAEVLNVPVDLIWPDKAA